MHLSAARCFFGGEAARCFFGGELWEPFLTGITIRDE